MRQLSKNSANKAAFVIDIVFVAFLTLALALVWYLNSLVSGTIASDEWAEFSLAIAQLITVLISIYIAIGAVFSVVSFLVMQKKVKPRFWVSCLKTAFWNPISGFFSMLGCRPSFRRARIWLISVICIFACLLVWYAAFPHSIAEVFLILLRLHLSFLSIVLAIVLLLQNKRDGVLLFLSIALAVLSFVLPTQIVS